MLDSVRALKGESAKRLAADAEADTADRPEPAAATVPRVATGVTFADIAGLEETLRMIYPARNPEALSRYGLAMGAGMLLFGPPGTGKTLAARAVAGELRTAGFSGADRDGKSSLGENRLRAEGAAPASLKTGV